MEIMTFIQGKRKKLFTQDACPNPAFRNTFQTGEFRCTIKSIQITDKSNEINLKEDERIITFHIQFMNMNQETIDIYCEDFMFQNDKNTVVYPLLLATDTLLEKITIPSNMIYEASISFIGLSNAKYMTLKYQEYQEEWEGKIYKLKYAIP